MCQLKILLIVSKHCHGNEHSDTEAEGQHIQQQGSCQHGHWNRALHQSDAVRWDSISYITHIRITVKKLYFKYWFPAHVHFIAVIMYVST